MLQSALNVIAYSGCEVEAVSPFITSRPVGPSMREYANGAAIVASVLSPQAMLAMLQAIELLYGRKRRGARWRARTLDLDIVLWDGGIVREQSLTIPHPHFRGRSFVLGPAAAIAPHWRDPVSGLTLRQLASRLARGRPIRRWKRFPPPRLSARSRRFALPDQIAAPQSHHAGYGDQILPSLHTRPTHS